VQGIHPEHAHYIPPEKTELLEASWLPDSKTESEIQCLLPFEWERLQHYQNLIEEKFSCSLTEEHGPYNKGEELFSPLDFLAGYNSATEQMELTPLKVNTNELTLLTLYQKCGEWVYPKQPQQTRQIACHFCLIIYP
jgi:hypothetical protein